MSPGAALVFLLAGPATNITSLTVLLGLLGKRATAIYLASIAVGAVLFGLGIDAIYSGLGISAQATMGRSAEFIPDWMKIIGVTILLVISIGPLFRIVRRLVTRADHHVHGAQVTEQQEACDCGETACHESAVLEHTRD